MQKEKTKAKEIEEIVLKVPYKIIETKDYYKIVIDCDVEGGRIK